MSTLKSGIILRDNEELVMELEAELWATSSNVFARMFGWLRKLIHFIFGIRMHSFLVITNQRVVEVRQTKACWVFNTAKDVKYVLPSSVKEVGYTKEGTFLGCCCQAYHLYYEAWTQRTSILLKGENEESAQRIVDAFYAAICAKQK